MRLQTPVYGSCGAPTIKESYATGIPIERYETPKAADTDVNTTSATNTSGSTFRDAKGREIPSEYYRIGAWTYFGLSLLFAIPIVGLVCLIIFSFNNGNINLRNYARSYFCVIVLVLFIILILYATGSSLLRSLF